MFVYLVLTISKNYAVLFNGSCNYFNYRHNTNIQLLNKILLQNSFSEDEIILMTGENTNKDKRNLKQQYSYLDSHNRITNDTNSFEDSSVQSLINILNLNHKKLLNCDKKSNLLIYLCGHGNMNFLKVKYREAIFSDDLNRRVRKLAERVGKVFILIDTCQASSFIPKNIPKNVFYLATAMVNEPSIFTYLNNNLGVYCIDNFMYSVYKRGLDLKSNLFDYFKYFDKEIIKSTIVMAGNKKFLISDFFE